MRKHWIDNLRWVTVLLVLLYHVFYLYNNKGVFGGIGGFSDGPQYQDAIMYILYPWFMPLLFILAGMSSRYALEKQTGREWFKSRTRKLLVPSTIGLFFFGFAIGYFNTKAAGAAEIESLPLLIKYVIWAISGIGPLWFIQDLWLLSIVILIINQLDRKQRLYNACSKLGIVPIILMCILFWLGHKTLIDRPNPENAEGLLNLYKPLFYLIPLLMGYFIFAHESVQKILEKNWIPLMCCAAVSGLILLVSGFGKDNTSPQFLQSPINNLYGYLMCLAMMGWFRSRFNRSGSFAAYMTRSSYGLYIVHYLVIASLGYYLKLHSGLEPIFIYIILTLCVFTLSPLLYGILRRIPFIRWCVFGEKAK